MLQLVCSSVQKVVQTVQMADKARKHFDNFGLSLPTAMVVGYGCRRHLRSALPNIVKGGLAVAVVAGVVCVAKSYLDVEPVADDAIEFLCSQHDDRLAEECLTDVVLDSSTLQSGTVPIDPGFIAGWNAGVGPASCSDAEAEDEVVASAITDDEVGASAHDETPKEDGPQKVINATKPLEARHSRALLGYGNKMTYSRRVFDACKAKFGTPKNTEANFKSVWRFAATMMKDHGLRPAHQSEILPLIVTKVFVPTLEELTAQKQVGVYKKMIEGKFDEQLSTWERWTKKCRRILQLE